MGSGGVASLFKLETSWRCVVYCTPLACSIQFQKQTGTGWTGGYVYPTVGLDILEKNRNSWPYRLKIPDNPAHSLVTGG